MFGNFSEELLAPESMKDKFMMLRCYVNDRVYIQVEVQGKRNLKSAKEQAIAILRKFYPKIKVVALLGLALDGTITDEYFRLNIADAFPWTVTVKQTYHDSGKTQRFERKTDALKYYRDLERQDVLVSSNAM